MYIIHKFSDYFKYLWFYVFELQQNKKFIIFQKLAFIPNLTYPFLYCIYKIISKVLRIIIFIFFFY